MAERLDIGWFATTSKDLDGIAAAVRDTHPGMARGWLVDSGIGAVGLLGTYSGAVGLSSLIGTAGTGAAISSLSGAVAHTATLAWIGFGSMAVGAVALPAAMAVGAVAVVAAKRRVWEGKGRHPDSLNPSEQRVVTGCTKLAIALAEQGESGTVPSKAEKRLFLSRDFAPVVDLVGAYRASPDCRARPLQSRLALRARFASLDKRFATVERWCRV